MAYMRAIGKRKCEDIKCGLPAEYEVFDTQHCTIGRFCAKHAHKELRNLKAEEVQKELDRIAHGPKVK